MLNVAVELGSSVGEYTNLQIYQYKIKYLNYLGPISQSQVKVFVC